MAKVLVSDPVAEKGVAFLRQAGLEVDVRTGLTKDELLAIIGDYEALAVRSETKVTKDVLVAAKKLKIIGRAGVGVDNIDVEQATMQGILVVNSPDGNTIAAAELTVTLLLSLARNVAPAHASMKQGEWKRSKYVGVEVYGKTVGVIGLGKIGREVAKRLRAMEMTVLAYDPFLSAEQAETLGISLVDLETLYRRSDFITVHVPKTKETNGMIGAEQIAMMQEGVRLINVARGGIIQEGALLDALNTGHVAGAALDVWESEPVAPSSPLALHANVLATPHLGASTEEAQIGVSVDIAEQIATVLAGGSARAAVNMPSLGADILTNTTPFLRLAERMGSLQAQLAKGSIASVEVRYEGEFEPAQIVHITRALLKGMLTPSLSESVNYVNAPTLAAGRGIKVTESKSPRADEYPLLLTMITHDENGSHTTSGTVFGKSDPHIVFLDGYVMDFRPEGYHLMVKNHDRPGMVGRIGTLLGTESVNIAGMYLGRDEKDGTAVMALSLDNGAPDSVLATIRGWEGIKSVRLVSL
jgi:D-3-phosphoglycerate dehydrogenase / 2-oxoglutarate reductase